MCVCVCVNIIDGYGHGSHLGKIEVLRKIHEAGYSPKRSKPMDLNRFAYHLKPNSNSLKRFSSDVSDLFSIPSSH